MAAARFLLYWICIRLIPVFAEDQNKLGSIFPNNNGIYIQTNKTLMLNCTLNENGFKSYDSSDLKFYFNSENGEYLIVPSNLHIVDKFTIQLKKPLMDIKDSGYYSCWIFMFGEPKLEIDSQEVQVQDPPEGVKNLSAVVDDWDVSLNISWQYSPKPDEVISVFLQPLPSPKRIICPNAVSSNTNFCVWAAADGFRQASSYDATVNVTNPKLGLSQAVVHRFMTNDIVKPLPVSNLEVVNVSSNHMFLKFTHVRVYRKKRYHITVNNEQHYDTNNSWINLTSLKPYTLYEISVQVHPEGDNGFWSDPLVILQSTEESVPSSSFPVHAGSYVLHDCDSSGNRNVTILWKSVSPEKRNGKITGYTVIYKGNADDVNKSLPTSATLSGISCNSTEKVQIFAKNKAGRSVTNSHLMILPDVDVKDLDFVIERAPNLLYARWNGSALRMSNHSDDNLTVFWCSGNILDKVCQDEITWLDTASNLGKVKLPVAENQSLQYIYGFSARNQRITWTDCVYYKNRVPSEEVEAVRVIVPEEPEQLLLQWKPQPCSYSFPYYVSGYIIHTCQLNHCAESNRSVHVNGGTTSEYQITNVAVAKYQFSVQAVIADGILGLSSQPVIGTPKSKEFSSDFAWIIAITLIILIVLLLFIGWFYGQYYI